MSLNFMGGYGSGHKLDFTGDPAIVCAQRARRKRREQEQANVCNTVVDDDSFFESIEQEGNKLVKRLNGTKQDIIRPYQKRIESLEKELRESRDEYNETLNELIEAESKLHEFQQQDKLVISVDLSSKDSIDRAKKIINSIDCK